MYMPALVFATLVFFAGADLARADWLDAAWSDESVAKHGNPAITVRPEGLLVALPQETLDEAHAEKGMTRQDALQAFLSRYSPQCSHVLDLNAPQPNLKVELSIQVAGSLEDLATNTQDEVFEAMEKMPMAQDAGKQD